MDEKAASTAGRLRELFGPEDFFLELQSNGLPEQEEVNKKLVELSRRLALGVVSTNDCHYLRKEDARAHDILLCIQTGKNINDTDRLRFGSEEFYFKSPEEMKDAFKELPHAVMNTRKIAERCNVEFHLGRTLLPRYEPPGGDPFAFLEGLAKEGLKKRFGENPPEAYRRRLSEELGVIRKMGYSSYFLIVWDFVNFAKEKAIPVGPGRGSAAGSLVSYSLGITEIDPMRYNLFFERFLNPERLGMPDIDMDFCKVRRAEVLAYVAEKYGAGHVAQIITFGTMAAKAAIRDVARVLGFPYQEADSLAKLIPEEPKTTIEDALKLEPKLKELYDSNPKVKELIDIATRLEGLSRHASTHAAGVVISPLPLTETVPLYRNPQDGTITTQFEMKSVSDLGLVKFDLLGLKTLTVLEKALNYLKSPLSLRDVPLDDPETYRLISSGETTGIFQLESPGMRDLARKMEPSRFEDLIALVALYRPGPIGSGMIEDYIKRKKGLVPVKYELPELKETLDETYGVILYQEQVMSIANKLAGFTMGQADALRYAMGKKKPEEMEKHKEAFIKGAVANRIPEKKAVRLFDLMAYFAEYGFNKSHSAAYAYLSYLTAYLKAHHPVEFMAATLSADMDSTDKVVKSIKECRSLSLDILPPDINLCGAEFLVAGRSIRFGLGAVKGVGIAAVEAVVEARRQRPFSSLEDFFERLDTKKVNKKVLEALIKAGAFDSLSPGEPPARARAKALGILSSPNGKPPSPGLFGPTGDAADSAGAMDEVALLKAEKEALGFYITGNPMSRHKKALAGMSVKSIAGLDEAQDRQEVRVAGVIGQIKKVRTRDKAGVMAYLTLEDEDGAVEVIVFPDLLKESEEAVKKDEAVIIRGSVDRTEKGVKLVAREVQALDGNAGNGPLPRKLEICIKTDSGCDTINAKLRTLRGLLRANPGKVPLYLRVEIQDASALILAGEGVGLDGALVETVEGFMGKGSVKVI